MMVSMKKLITSHESLFAHSLLCNHASSSPSASLHRSFQVLTNDTEVKLQRNALSVIEAFTGNEEDDDLEFDNRPLHTCGCFSFNFLPFLTVDAIPNPSKEQLIDVVQKHFIPQMFRIRPLLYYKADNIKAKSSVERFTQSSFLDVDWLDMDFKIAEGTHFIAVSFVKSVEVIKHIKSYIVVWNYCTF